MWIAIGLATAMGFWLAYQKYHYFNGDTNDLVIYSYAFSQTLAGHFFPLYYSPQGSLIGNHPNLIVVLWLPVYALWRSFYSLLFYQSLILTIGAWPFYLLAKDLLKNERVALILGLAFLLFPTIASQHVNQIHDDQFALPFVMAAFYFYHRKDFPKFLVALILACSAKETITITTAAFGVYALVQRRSAKWVITPPLFSGLYLAFAIFLVTKILVGGTGASQYVHMQYLEAYGKSPAEVLHTFLTRPGYVLDTMLTEQKREYLFKLLLPVLFVLPWLTASVIVSLPNLLLNLVSTNTALVVIPWHYNSILGATLLVAMVFSLRKLADRFGPKILLPLATASLVFALFGLSFWLVPAEYRPKSYYETLRRVVDNVPPDASVLAPTPMLAEFTNRPKVDSAYTVFIVHRDPAELLDYNYVVIDGNWRGYEAMGQGPLVETINSTHAYRVLFMENNIALLRRVQ
jgi:uncharacterized membrane protein